MIKTIGGGSGGGSTILGFTDGFSLGIKAADTNALPTDAGTFAIALLQGDTNTAPTELVQLAFPAGDFGDSSNAPTDGQTEAIRVWGTGATDNDSSKTTPANANAANDSVRATVKTALSLGDLTNPVTLSSAAFSGVPAGTYTSKKIRVYFNIPARTTTLDTLTLAYNIGSGDVVIFTHSGTAAVDNNAGQFTFDVSGLTVAQCQAMVLKANYLASVVATPETVINLDAWAVELLGSF